MKLKKPASESRSDTRIEKILLWIVKIGLYGSLILPFIVSKTTLYPYIFGKAVFFVVLIEILTLFWVALIYFWPEYRPKMTGSNELNRSHSPKRQMTPAWLDKLTSSPQVLLNWSIIAFFAALILSTLLGADPVRSFWGTQERMTGVFTLLHFGLFYFMLISVMRTRKDWLWFLRGIVLTGSVVSIWALQQGLFGLIKGRNGTQIWFGNPGITGSVLLFFVFLTAICGLIEIKSRKRKFSLAVSIVLISIVELIVLAAVIINATRATWVGLFVAVILGLFLTPLYLGQRQFKQIYKVLSLSLAGAILVFTILIVSGKLPSRIYERLPFLNRAVSIVQSVNQANTRIMSWQQGLRSWASFRAFLGFGPENYYIAFNRYYNPALITLGGSQLDFDKAHNQPLENLVGLGIIGFAAYLGIFAVAGRFLLKKELLITKFILFLLIIAYFIHLLFTFDTPTSYWLFFISLGLIYYFIKLENASEPSSVKSKKDLEKKGAVGAISLTLIIIVVLMSLYYVNFKTYQASHKAAIAKAAANTNEPVETIFNFYYQALQYQPVQAFEIRKMMGEDVLNKVKEYGLQYNDILKFTSSEMQKNSKNDYHAQLVLGMIYNILGSKDRSYYNQALSALLSAKKLAPSRNQIYTELAGAYFGIRDYPKALNEMEQALSLGYKPTGANHYIFIGLLYGENGKLKESLAYYQKALEFEPGNIKILGSIAALYKELGQKEQAREIAEQMLKLEPALEGEVRQFLEGLGG